MTQHFTEKLAVVAANVAAMEQPSTDQPRIADQAAEATTSTDLAVEDELLVEEISIDGMCGVY
jgi:mycofactocin precursor